MRRKRAHQVVTMYENFRYEARNNEIEGYLWDCESPDRVLCIIHGIGEHAGRYDRMCESLRRSNIATVSMDHRGHGKSIGPVGHAAPRGEVLKDVDAMLEYASKKYEGVPITLYGHSMGGNICLDYRNRGDLNDVPASYIVSAPWVKLVRNVSKPLYLGMKFLAKVAPKAAMDNGCKSSDLGNKIHVASYDTDPYVHSKVSFQTAAEGYDIGKALGEGTHPCNHRADNKPFLLMHGDSDKICSVEGSRMIAEQNKNNPYFRYIEWPGYYHEIHNGGPKATGDAVIETIREFVLK